MVFKIVAVAEQTRLDAPWWNILKKGFLVKKSPNVFICCNYNFSPIAQGFFTWSDIHQPAPKLCRREILDKKLEIKLCRQQINKCTDQPAWICCWSAPLLFDMHKTGFLKDAHLINFPLNYYIILQDLLHHP